MSVLLRSVDDEDVKTVSRIAVVARIFQLPKVVPAGDVTNERRAVVLHEIYLLSTCCASGNYVAGELPSLIWAVLFPVVTLAAVLIADWIDKNVSIQVRVKGNRRG